MVATSRDGGRTWSTYPFPVGDAKDAESYGGLVLDTADGRTVYGMTFPLDVRRSTDGGVTWQQIVTLRRARPDTIDHSPGTVGATRVAADSSHVIAWDSANLAGHSRSRGGGGMWNSPPRRCRARLC